MGKYFVKADMLKRFVFNPVMNLWLGYCVPETPWAKETAPPIKEQ